MNKQTWNYNRPTCLWEQLPWQIRWPVGVAATLYFGGGFAIGIVGHHPCDGGSKPVRRRPDGSRI
jgi:hypothetical protein